MTEERKATFRKHLPRVVIGILIFFFVGGIVIGAGKIMHMEGAYPPYEANAAIVEPPETPAAAVALFDDAISAALREMPKTDAEDDCSVEGDIVFSAGNEYVELLADAAEDAIEDAYDDAYDAPHADFAESLDGILGGLKLSEADVTDVVCEYISYVCSNCGASYKEYVDVCETCELTGTLEQRLNDNYVVTFAIAPESESFRSNFVTRSPEDMQTLLQENGKGFYNVDMAQISYSEPSMTMTVGRTDGKLKRLDFNAKAELTATLTFAAPYEAYGTTDVACTIRDDIRYNFTWPSISLPDQEPMRPGKTYYAEPKKTEAVQAKLTCDDPAKYDVVWRSSDESVFTVDDDGYIKAGKNAGEAVLTASFEFNGKTYSDSVTIYVRVPVEQLKFNKYNLKLAVGESFTLQTTTDPKNASVQTVTWYSADESVATVDENGKVTAIASGETVIYALSDDGYYRASCETVVK